MDSRRTGLSYEARALMPETDHPVRITAISRAPVIRIAGRYEELRVRRLVDRAHELCFIAKYHHQQDHDRARHPASVGGEVQRR